MKFPADRQCDADMDTSKLLSEKPATLNAPVEKPSHRRVGALDGLRALCALAVVGYHMGLPWLSGGLLGVTVFFVLSGYLATDSLAAEFTRRRGTVDLKSYYERRLRRLAPQAIACIVVTLVLCTLFNHVLLTKMRPDILPALLMYLNWSKIATNVSYFAAAGLASPLTHYWSLAIEWQFYLIWPPILALLMRHVVPKKKVRVGLIVAAAASVALMAYLYTPGADPSRAYFGTDTRAMSLLVGCWLALVLPLGRAPQAPPSPWRMKAELAGLASIGLLLLLMVTTKGYTAFSYYGGVALVSLLAVVAIAALLPTGTIISRMLSAPPLTWIGRRSYALYLWHYPIVLLLTNSNSTVATPWWTYALQLALSLGAADLSYRLIEVPCGQRGFCLGLFQSFWQRLRSRSMMSWVRGHTLAFGLVVVMLATAFIGLLFVPPEQAVGGASEGERLQAASLRKPLVEGVYDVVLIGDSVPLDAYDDLSSAFPYGLIDCKIGRQMSAGIDVLEDYVSQGIVGDEVICCLGSNGALTEGQIKDFVAAAGEGKTIWFVNNRVGDDWQDSNNTLLADFAASYEGVHVVDWYGASEGHDDWFWHDGVHVTPAGAVAYAQTIKDAMGYEAPTTENTTYSTLILGDTVALGACDELASAFPSGAVDCAEGRGVTSASKKFATYVAQGVVGTNVVLAVGNESPLSQDELESFVSSVGDGRTLWLVNDRANAQWQDDNNEILAHVADEHDNVHLIDWHASSQGHSDYFSGDGTNLSTTGAQAYAALISAAISTQGS